MIWAFWNRAGHAVLKIEEHDGQAVMAGACGEEYEYPVDVDEALPDSREAASSSDRPFGVDSCRVCHSIAKHWTIEPASVPDGLFDPPEPVKPKRLTAEERRAAVNGTRATEPVSMQGDRARTPAGGSRSRRGAEDVDVDDLEFPAEPGQPSGATIVDGATLVLPGGGGGRKRQSREKEDIDIDRG